MSQENAPCIVIARHRNRGQALEVGDVVDVYPLQEDFDEYVDDGQDEGLTGELIAEPHTMARQEGQQVLSERDGLRVLQQTGCDCSRKGKATPLAVAYARHGQMWIWVREQSFPKTVLDDVLMIRSAKSKAWPAHKEPNGYPHTEISTCKHCRKHWAIAITDNGYKVIRVGRPAFGSSITK